MLEAAESPLSNVLRIRLEKSSVISLIAVRSDMI